MTVQVPTPRQILEIADQMGLSLTDADVESFIGILRPSIAAYNIIDAMPDNLPEVKYARTPGRRPLPEENKFNAWYIKTTVLGAPEGKLKGRTVVLKDNIMLAGVPMMNGAATLEGYVPNIDATVVTRILDAGGTIVGKAHCESFCLSGGSHTSASGPVHNPRKMGYSAGGSSSGSAALVAAGEVDMALGGDQGGSIRIPASFCGIYGMKPTHGLVPYTGIMPIEIFVDHTGPMTANVADNALLLEVLAGPDGYDPRHTTCGCSPIARHSVAAFRDCASASSRKVSSRPMPRKMSTRRSAWRRSALPGLVRRWARCRSRCILRDQPSGRRSVSRG